MPSGTGSMPKAVYETFEPLRNELVRIHERWALYQQLFGVDADRIDLLNRVACSVFGYTQWAMYFDVTLALCRYTDPAESSKKIGHRPNLTLERLVHAVVADDPTVGTALATNELDAVNKWRDAYFDEIRSKRIAHNDLSKMVARFNGQPTGWPSREQVGSSSRSARTSWARFRSNTSDAHSCSTSTPMIHARVPIISSRC